MILDRSSLIQLLGPEFREYLRANDHVFVEAAHVKSGIFYFGVWGYGPHDRNGFRWSCEYSLRDRKVSCGLGK